MEYHKHWVYGSKWQENKSHPISQKHKNIQSQLRHDMATGQFQSWVKKNNLRLVDATYDRYQSLIKAKAVLKTKEYTDAELNKMSEKRIFEIAMSIAGWEKNGS